MVGGEKTSPSLDVAINSGFSHGGFPCANTEQAVATIPKIKMVIFFISFEKFVFSLQRGKCVFRRLSAVSFLRIHFSNKTHGHGCV